MKHVGVLLSLAAAAAGAAIGSRSLPESGPPLPMGEIGWEGSVIPGGPLVKIWGADLDDIEAKIKKDHPDFSMFLDVPNEADPVESSENPAVEAVDALEKRRNGNCDSRFGKADVGYYNDGVHNLRRINGNRCVARARTCIRTQCVRTSAIGLCNDNHHEITVQCTDIANMADTIRLHCGFSRWPLVCAPGRPCQILEHWTHGQEFANSGNWNVLAGSCGYFGGGERPV
ncbi:hypothetical protein B0T11DRAFT_356454 [Plectosphaerella cucumerina]|uniref:Uncharacterized protein n=1 Tax=Plectosphaerella cucumerina TaxID=40658 RepID=A0A8K0X0N4_9PEZI|nr:hypothetical protein B0T11DRAFT_356454 [Plectosphaerella cucumerina]